MVVGISGGRGDGTPWPPRGGELDVSDEEGVSLCRARLAIPVAASEPPVETPEQPLAAAVEQRAEPEPASPPAAEKPALNAPKSAWVEWAISQGAGIGSASDMTKQQLIAAYG